MADKKPKELVICLSRIFAFEKWQLLVTTMEVYRYLQVDLIVTHVNSAITSIYELMKAYEEEGLLAIRAGIQLPIEKGMLYNPNSEVEYSGQLMLAHECVYEFRESAKFIALLDWDDLLITTEYKTLVEAFQKAAIRYPIAPYFLVNKLESTFVEQGII